MVRTLSMSDRLPDHRRASSAARQPDALHRQPGARTDVGHASNPHDAAGHDFAQISVLRPPPTSAVNSVRDIAAAGLRGREEPYPYKNAIEGSFGRLLLARAFADDAATAACEHLGAAAYTFGDGVAFRTRTPSLFTAAHEAAHVLRQATGAAPADGEGRARDSFEREANFAASLVKSGRSAAHLFASTTMRAPVGGAAAVQLQAAVEGDVATATENLPAKRDAKAPTLGAKPAAASKTPEPDVKAMFDAALEEWWQARGDLKARLLAYAVLYRYRFDVTSVYIALADRVGAPRNMESLRKFREAYVGFINTKLDVIFNEMKANPDIGAPAWADVLGSERGADFQRDPKLKAFADRVEAVVLPAYAAGTKGSKGARSEREVTDLHGRLRQAIINNNNEFFDAVLTGLNKWHMPPLSSDDWAEWLAGAGTLGGAAGSIATVGAASAAAATLGIGLLVAGAALGVASIIKTSYEADAADRHRLLEQGIRDVLIDAFSKRADITSERANELSFLIIGDARKAGEKITTNPEELEMLAWSKLFAGIPRGRGPGGSYITRELQKRLSDATK